jgi:hypothetical protein
MHRQWGRSMSQRWSEAQAAAWHADRPVPVGCNFIPSTAANQLEMWDPATFDTATIARELAWAADIGFNAVRVYLHDLAFAADPAGFIGRVRQVLGLADEVGIRVLLVLFDDCWHEPVPGPQPQPVPGVHNSRWLRSPGRQALLDRSGWKRLEHYVTALGRALSDDARVLGWDLYNEITNLFLPAMSRPGTAGEVAMADAAARREEEREPALALLGLAMGWLRATGPSQPLTAGVWSGEAGLNAQLCALSDIISFHHYRSSESLEREIARLSVHRRPLWCTEYLSRRDGCLFQTHLPRLLAHRIGAFNWGLVDGKTQTRFAWSDPPGGPEPDVWFHDILHADGSPHDPREAEFLRTVLMRS